MNKEQKLLIASTNAYFYQKNIDFPDDIKLGDFYKLARQHNLAPIVYSVLKQTPSSLTDKNAVSEFENTFFDCIYRYECQEKAINEISDILSENKIYHVFFKGSQIKNYYPLPSLRAMGDIDILINENDRLKVKSILVDNGYTCKNSNGPVFDYEKDGILIEMHTKIISGKVGTSSACDGFLDAIEHAEFNGYRGTLNPNYHFAYLIAHIAHHFWFYGAGIKLVLDLAVMQKQFDIDFDYVFNKLDEIQLLKFGKVILSVCSKWYGIGKIYCQDTEKTEEFLLNFGAFGNLDRNKSAVVERKELEEGKKPSRFMTTLRLVFPPYKKLKDIPYVKFIEGRPYLTPFAWIYRLIYNLKNRKEFVKEATATIGDEKTHMEAEKELSYFEEIGLA